MTLDLALDGKVGGTTPGLRHYVLFVFFFGQEALSHTVSIHPGVKWVPATVREDSCREN